LIAADHAWVLAAALILDALVGDPDFLWRRIPHPVALFGELIAFLDRTLNDETQSPDRRRLAGVLAVAILVVSAGLIGVALEILLRALPFGWIGTTVIAAVFLAGRSLYDQVAAVAVAFADGLPAARKAVSRIVGRDPDALDEPAICRAAIESTAENFSDGVIAPGLWFLVLGLPGLLAYKAINTADSMIGHRTSRHSDFGWAAARLDDLVNLPASRLAGALIALVAPTAGGTIGQAFRVMAKDAPGHRSPNAGWPEAAMAASLGVALAGPRSYGGAVVADPFMNAEGRRDATPNDIRRGLRVYLAANALFLVFVLVLAGLLRS
jgi:adenosylcobinamide-phosphate synthase